MAAMIGRVLHWDDRRRFGKLRAAGRDYFVHRDDLVDVLALRWGQAVEFEPVETPKGPRAAEARVVQEPNSSVGQEETQQ